MTLEQRKESSRLNEKLRHIEKELIRIQAGFDGEGIYIYPEKHPEKPRKSKKKPFRLEFRGITENLFDKEYSFW